MMDAPDLRTADKTLLASAMQDARDYTISLLTSLRRDRRHQRRRRPFARSIAPVLALPSSILPCGNSAMSPGHRILVQRYREMRRHPAPHVC